MGSTLEDRVIDAVVALWQDTNEPVKSEVVYQHLLAAGETIPPGALDTIFRDLQMSEIIGGTQLINDRERQEHGGFVITWIDPSLLEA